MLAYPSFCFLPVFKQEGKASVLFDNGNLSEVIVLSVSDQGPEDAHLHPCILNFLLTSKHMISATVRRISNVLDMET